MTTLTDISSDVEAVFEDMECIWVDGSPHEGDKAAYVQYHDCEEGWWCAFHYRRFINEHLPVIRAFIGTPSGRCPECKQSFHDVESYVKVYPL